MAGFYKGGCEELHCIDKVKCCQMFESECHFSNYYLICEDAIVDIELIKSYFYCF